MEDGSKHLNPIEIKPPPPLPRFSTDMAIDNLQDHSNPSSKSSLRKRRNDTWIISVFVILHVVAFVVTIFVNDCWRKSYGDCALKSLGRFSSQPLEENPFLGPSASTLDEMGALRRKFLADYHQKWRLFTFPILHAGYIHIVINLCSMVYIGVHLEQEYGPLRVGIIYILSALTGSLVAALFVQNTPAVGPSGPLYGLLGAMLSGLILNWRLYTNKFTAVASLLLVSMINFALGLLPYVDNFSSIGGFVSGILLGLMLLFSPQVKQVVQNKGGLYEYSDKFSIIFKLRQKLDRPGRRFISLLLFSFIVAGCLIAVLHSVNMNRYCEWCRYIDCAPFRRWDCKEKVASCKTMESNAQLTLTCMNNGNFRVLPFTNITKSRLNDLCSVICG